MSVEATAGPRSARWVPPGAGPPLREWLRSPVVSATATAVALSAVYLAWSPHSPDLAAQVARAAVVRRAGYLSWWTGWFGGLSLPTYSLLSPALMAWLGVCTAGALAAVLGVVATAHLLEGTARPRAGAIAFAVAELADLFAGRVTFVIGFCVAAWALLLLRRRHPVLAAAASWLSYLASPLAGLFLGIALVATGWTNRQLRRAAWVSAGGLLTIAAAMAGLFPSTGTMPFSPTNAWITLLGCAAVALACPPPVLRTTAWLTALATVVFLVDPGAVGNNITRFSWMCAAPIVIATATWSRRWLAALAALLAFWPLGDLAGQLSSAADASTRAAYYAPLAAELRREAASGGGAAVGGRVEVVDTANHWASAYLAPFALARGWDRQADVAQNSIFYRPGALTADSYQAWLAQLAVRWVALPTAKLDFGAVREAELVRSDPSYLHRVWSTPQWTLYRVDHPAPLAVGARVAAVEPGGVTLATSAPATVLLQVRWSPYLVAVDPATGTGVPLCLADAAGWVQLTVPRAQTIEVTSRFNLAERLDTARPDPCPAPAGSGRTAPTPRGSAAAGARGALAGRVPLSS